MRISHSEIETFNKCERKHWYQYGQKLEPLRQSQALRTGILFHEACERYFKLVQADQEAGKSFDRDELRQRVLTEFAIEHPDEIETYSIIQNYLRLQQLDRYFIFVVEDHFLHELPNGVTISFKVDLIVQNESGEIIVVDHKTVQNLFKDYELNLKPQLPLYAGALIRGGFPINGAAYSQIKKKPAQKDTDYDIYKYEPIELSEARMKRAEQEFITVAKRIETRRNNLEHWEANTSRNTDACKYCIFKTLCSKEMLGRETEARAIQYTDFQISERKSSENVIQYSEQN